MRFPPALEAFDHHGVVSKLLYLILPTAQVCFVRVIFVLAVIPLRN